jgi:hypothetical protein
MDFEEPNAKLHEFLAIVLAGFGNGLVLTTHTLSPLCNHPIQAQSPYW